MDVWKVVLRLWALLSLLSLAIDGFCIWLDSNGTVAPLRDAYDTYHVSHVTLFLFSAPAPFVLAIVMPILGAFLVFIRWSLGISKPAAPPRKEPRTAAIARPSRAAMPREDAA